MRRQVTVGGLVALALLTGSVVAFAQPPVPADCAPADTEVAREGLVPGALAQDDPDEDAPAEDPEEPSDATSDDPADEDPVDDEPTDDEPEPSTDRPAEDPEDPDADEPGADEPGAAAPADDEPGADDPGAQDPGADDPAGDEPMDDDPAAGDDPTGDEPAGDEPAGDEPAGERPTTDDPGTADDPASGSDPCVAGAAEQTAAAALEWGTPTREDDFDGTLDRAWEVYSGTGFDGQGTRTADALTTQDGVLTITGDAEGATGGMAWGPGQMYGRWEARVRTPESDPSYDALLLLWPDDESGAGSEVDFMEMLDPTRQTANAFLHSGGETVEPMGEVAVDATQWHNWAVEWTPTSITAYLDGAEWWSVDDPDLLPQGPMHLCVQLDWFPTGEGEVQESSMQVDWVREYAVDAPATAAAPGDDPTGGDEPAGDPAADDPAGNDTGDDADAGDGGDPNGGDPNGGDPNGGDPNSGDPNGGDPNSGDPNGGHPKRGDPDSGDGDGKGGDSGGGDDSGNGDAEGVPSASLLEGAPDSPARAGLVTGPVAAPRS